MESEQQRDDYRRGMHTRTDSADSKDKAKDGYKGRLDAAETTRPDRVASSKTKRETR
jgi:hypothetical protein